MTASKTNQIRFSKITPNVQRILKEKHNIDHNKLLLGTGLHTTLKEERLIDTVIDKHSGTRYKIKSTTTTKPTINKGFKVNDNRKSLEYLLRIAKEVSINV
jgi:hypothetical protein